MAKLLRPGDAREQREETPAARPNTKAGGKIKMMTLTEMREQVKTLPSIKWVVYDLITDNGLSLIVSRPKVGKSRLAVNLAASVVQGESFLGRPTMRGNVLYFQAYAEGDHRRLVEIADAIGIKPEHEHRLLLHCGSEQNVLEELDALVMEHKPVLVIIDSLGTFNRTYEINSNTKMLKFLEPLAGIARTRYCNILSLAHTAKMGRKSILGATSIEGSADTNIFYYKIERTQVGLPPKVERVIESSQRYGQPIDVPVIVDMDEITNRVSIGEYLHMERLKEVFSDIARAIVENAGQLPEPQILAKVNRDRNMVLAALRWGLGSGRLERTGTGLKGNPFVYGLKLQYIQNEMADDGSMRKLLAEKLK